MVSALQVLKACVPGQACSLCYAIFSVWGCIMLLLSAAALNAGYRKIDNETLKDDDINSIAIQVYIAGGVYAACVAGCGIRWWWVTYKNPPPLKVSRFQTQLAKSETV